MTTNNFFAILFFLLLVPISKAYTQNENFTGIIELENKTYIDLRISFDIIGNKVEGYTITDYNGAHESKSSILGSYDKKTDMFTFRELSILYTKSPITEVDFCYIYFTGMLKNDRLIGNFKGYYEDLTKCLDGKIIGLRLEKAEKQKQTVLRKVNKIVNDTRKRDKVTEDIKNLNFSEQRGIEANENINVFWDSTYLKAQIWDAGTVDNDKIEISKDGSKPILINPKKEPIIQEYYLGNDKTIITIKALSEGTEPPNTTKVKFTNDKGMQVELIYNLKLNETASLTFYTNRKAINKK